MDTNELKDLILELNAAITKAIDDDDMIEVNSLMLTRSLVKDSLINNLERENAYLSRELRFANRKAG